MIDQICNIYCVGRNYKAHAEELGNELPQEPMIFTKPTHALAAMDGGAVELPGSQGSIHYEAELVIRIGKAWKPGASADELIDRMAFGIDFTLRDVQARLKEKGLPWLPAKGFRNSAALGRWLPFPGVDKLTEREFVLKLNGDEVQRGRVALMIFNLQTVIDYIGSRYGLGSGDLIYTGTPEGVGPVSDQDRLELFWGEEAAGSCLIRL